MLIKNNWSKTIKIMKKDNNILEDFVVERSELSKDVYIASYVTGPSFGNMRFHNAVGTSPYGPFENECEKLNNNRHTRISKAIINENEFLITMVHPGLPYASIWHIVKTGNIFVRRLLISPKSGTLFSIVAANPTIIKDKDGDYNIFFEGRNKEVKWRIFQAVWNPDRNYLKIIDEPICDGGNPTIVKFDDKYYLYYSKYIGNGFETVVMVQNE